MTAIVERTEIKGYSRVRVVETEPEDAAFITAGQQLRRVECDARDAAILCAVLRGARTYRTLVEDIGASYGSVHFRITGTECRGARRTGGGLVARGLLRGERENGTLRPGPRLAGIDHGWPLELVEVEV